MAQEDTKQEQVNPADELKKAAEAAEQAQGSELPPELGIEPEGAEASLEDQLAAATAKAAENFDLYVRAVAEMENVRRRAAEDVSKAQKFSIEKFAKNLLPVMDSVHALEMSGMTVIDPKDAKFDPNTQQAIAMVPAVEGKSAGDVAQVFQHGWKIYERVLRPAMVSVVQG